MSSASAKSFGVQLVTWLLLLLSLAAAVALVVRAARRPYTEASAAPDPLALVPPGARLLVTVDVASLTRVAASDLLRLGGDKLLGLEQTCGFEPLLAVQRAVLAMPSGAGAGDRGSDFALIAATRLSAERGLSCAERVITKRGGKPARGQLGAFTSVRDLNKPLGEVALRSDGMLVLSGGQYFRDVMDVAAGTPHGDEAASLRSQLHRSLRSKLGRAQLLVTLLPEPSSLLRGVLAVALALEIERDVALRGLIACVSAEACAGAREVLEHAKRDLAREPGLSGLGAMRVSHTEDRLELAGRLPREQLGPLLAQLVAP